MSTPDELRRFKAEIFGALAHPTRIAILEALNNCDLSGQQLVELLELDQRSLFHHLTALRAKDIVGGRKAGSQVVYFIKDKALAEVLSSMRGYFQRQSSRAARQRASGLLARTGTNRISQAKNQG